MVPFELVAGPLEGGDDEREVFAKPTATKATTGQTKTASSKGDDHPTPGRTATASGIT